MNNLKGVFVMPHPPIIISEVGKGEEEKVRNTIDACKKIADEVKKLNPDNVIVISPHGAVFSGAVASFYADEEITGDLSKFGVPDVKMKRTINTYLTSKITGRAEDENLVTVNIHEDTSKSYGVQYELDHGALVPLYFINEKYDDYKIVDLSYGLASKYKLYKLGMIIKEEIEKSGETAVVITSGDLSHALKDSGPYAFNPAGPRLDAELLKMLEHGEVDRVFSLDKGLVENASECGLRSIYVMLGILDGTKFSGEVLSYEGEFGVGYGVVRFNLKRSAKSMFRELIENEKENSCLCEKAQSEYVKLAIDSIHHYILTGEDMEVPDWVSSDLLEQKKGVFVSLKIAGDLRGCIGTIYPVCKNVAEEIIRNAVEAGEYDPRFNPVLEEELYEIDFSVDILEEATSATVDELDVKRFGVIVRCGQKTGLLLPNLDGVNEVSEQLDIALRKAGIGGNEKYTIEKFEVIRYR